MTRQECEQIVRQPGKFEGCAAYVPYYGAGYWDGDYPHDVGRRLTDAAHVYGTWDEFTAWAMEQNEEEAT